MSKKCLWFILIAAICLSACRAPASAIPQPTASVEAAPTPKPLPASFPYIERYPAAADWGRGAMKTMPTYDPNSEDLWQMDLRSYDLSALDLRNSLDDLMFADFDDLTMWPPADRMPSDFDWQRIMELGKNPGLGMRSLHEQGITGRGVSIAIIDQPLLIDHQEYADRVRLYEDIAPDPDGMASMHAPAVVSIAIGKTVGVAPEADLYFLNGFTGQCFKTPEMYHCLARGIRRLLQINATLPVENKIRVISISRGFMPGDEGSDDWAAAIQEAQAAGVMVVYSNSELLGGGRAPLADPDDYQSFEPGLFWAQEFYSGGSRVEEFYSSFLYVPMDSRTTAAPNGTDSYAFYRSGGMSWAIPYVAGMYALACQVDPTMTPERFWKLALQTGRAIEFVHEGQTYTLGPILDPAALIEALKQ